MDLETVLSPVGVPEFLDQYFGRSFLNIAGSPGKFSGLVALGGIDDVPEPVAMLAQELERALEAPIRINLLGDSTSVPLHRRERDAILLQIGGQSDCQVHGDSGEPPSGNAPAWVGLLRPGDALYVPRGWWLCAGPGGMRVSFEIENPTGADLLDWVVEHVKQDQAFQADIPRFTDPATKADYVTGLRKVLGRVLRSPHLLEGYRRAANRDAQPGHASGIPWSANAPEDHLIAILTPRRIRIKRADNQTILLVAMGKRLRFPAEAAPLLHFLSDRAPVPIADFYATFTGEFDRDELCDFLSALSRDGIIGLREPHAI